MEDISKFSALLEHANYHQQVYGDDFFDFLSEHYGEQMALHEKEHNGHENLPFKDGQHIFTHINTAFTLFSIPSFTVHSQTFAGVPLNFFYKETFSLFEKPSVFQPPKLA